MSRVSIRVRWWVFACLFATAFLGYVQRTSVAIAAERMMPELGLSQQRIGWLLTAFLIGYSAFQLPGAIAGQGLGARRALTALGLLTVLATVVTATAPLIGFAVFVALLGARFTLGVAQAALFPVASGAIEQWFPVGSWGFAQGLLVTGLWLGTAATPPLVAWMMAHWGWKIALLVPGVPALLLSAIWQWYARDRPAEHPGVSGTELAELPAEQTSHPVSPINWRRIVGLLRNRPLLLITASYALTNYVFYLVTFWCFLYLVQERRFSTLEGGWLASLPFLAAAVAAGAGGKVSDALCARWGERKGLRMLPLAALPSAAVFLYLTVTASGPYWAVVALCLAFGCVEMTEGPFWAATMRTEPADSMAATAVLNTGGNLGGLVATPVIAALSAQHSWTVVFATGAVLSVTAAALWLWIDVRSLPEGAASSQCLLAGTPV